MILAKSVLHTPNTPRAFPDAVTAAAAAVSIYSGLRSRRDGTEKQEKLHIVMAITLRHEGQRLGDP